MWSFRTDGRYLRVSALRPGRAVSALAVVGVVSLFSWGGMLAWSPHSYSIGEMAMGAAQTRGDVASPEPGESTANRVDVTLLNRNDVEFGTATFTEEPDGSVSIIVTVRGTVRGIEPGEYGIHVHERGVCDPTRPGQFASAGGHYNPDDTMHGGPPTPGANEASGHAGDLGNIRVEADGRGELRLTTDRFTLAELRDADGSSLVVHRDRDDLVTNPEGQSGPRIFCGVIFPPERAATPEA